eukprot:16579-Eustigmatos_ZCMA.PRE.1
MHVGPLVPLRLSPYPCPTTIVACECLCSISLYTHAVCLPLYTPAIRGRSVPQPQGTTRGARTRGCEADLP